MTLLLDTHVFIWLATEPDRLTPRARALCQDVAHDLVLSLASIWEMQIKHQLGKLTFATSLADMIALQQAVNGITLLPIELAHVLALQALPPLHKDPFDRMLLAQTMVEGLTLLTADGTLPAYPVSMLHV